MQKLILSIVFIGIILSSTKLNAQGWLTNGTKTTTNPLANFVGINTANPLAQLHVNNGSILFDGTTGTTPSSGAGTRMMWIPSKSAFRAGIIFYSPILNNPVDYWDETNIGIGSCAFNQNTKASGSYSAALGNLTIASGGSSFASGQGTIASGNLSFATNNGSKATGYGSFSMGQGTNANGIYSLATGGYTTAQATFSSTFGNQTEATSFSSFVIGQYNVTGSYSTTSWVSTDPLFIIGNGQSASSKSNALIVLKNGNVGIGTNLTNNTSNYKLSVNGDVRAKKVVVETGWSDFVFEAEYKLRSLQELEIYIQQYGHLPEIPSANTIENNGADIGELLKLQMQKIEELTLYIIEQEKRIRSLEKETK